MEMIVEEGGEYRVSATPIGSLFFKHLMSKAMVDIEVNSNTEQFNQWVYVNCQSQLARGEQ
eukprot:12860098-Ditylum_brightwellii.AAC.1